MTDPPCDPHLEEAYRFLRGHTTADMRFDEHLRPVKYVVAKDGRLIVSVMVAMLESPDTVLFIPETTEEAMELMVTLEPFEDRGADGAAADRWRIHHGEPLDVRWAYATIDAARHASQVLDGDALMREDPLAADEPRLCRWLNSEHQAGVRGLCRTRAEKVPEAPVVVAVDPGGIDVRGEFAVYRVETTEPMHNADDVERVLRAMLNEVAARGEHPA
jgi:hypothetical protein